MNKVMLLGRLVRDPEMKGTNGSVAVCRFTVACSRPKSKSQDTPEADFINCVALGKTAELVNSYFKKGNRIIIEDGSIQTGSFVSPKTGQKVYTTDVLVRSIGFVDTRKDTQQNYDDGGSNYNGAMGSFGSAMNDELPF